MGVITEAYSIIIKNSTIAYLYPGGQIGYEANVPNSTYCTDGNITRIGFMVGDDNKAWVKHLLKYGFNYIDENGKCKDICIYSSNTGALYPCDWLEFTKDDEIFDGTTIARLKGTEKNIIAHPEDRESHRGGGMYYAEDNTSSDLKTGVNETIVGGVNFFVSKAIDGEVEEKACVVMDDDGTTSSIIISSPEQFSARIVLLSSKIQAGLQKYQEIMALFSQTNVSEDKDFQTKYNHFYKLIRRKPEFYTIYYGLMEELKANTNISYSEIITYLYEKSGRCEKSFSSKLLHTLNPDMPIRDQYVLRNLGLSDPGSDLEACIRTYQQMCMLMQQRLNSEEGRMIIQLFDQYYPDSGITNMKKYDFYLRQLRD